jgi:hypothetical protein
VWWIFVYRSHCSLPYLVHICARILLFVIWCGACLATDSGVHCQIWFMFWQRFCCSLSGMVLLYYRFCCSLLGRWFCCSLPNRLHVWAEVLFIIWYGECLDRSSAFHCLIWSMFGHRFWCSLSRTSYKLAEGTIIRKFLWSHFCQIRTILLIFPVIFSVALVNTGRRYIKCATGSTTRVWFSTRARFFSLQNDHTSSESWPPLNLV